MGTIPWALDWRVEADMLRYTLHFLGSVSLQGSKAQRPEGRTLPGTFL